MRRSVLFLAAVLPLLNLACEDGPTQPYSPAPAGAAGIWNGPPGGGLVEGGTYSSTSTENYDAGFGGTNANVTCTADQAKAIWNNLFQEPFLPPGIAGGIDIAGGPTSNGASGYTGPGTPYTYDPTKETWSNATVEQAEAVLCSGTPDSVYYGETNTIGWGAACPSCELSALYNTSNRNITDLLLQYGYGGTMTGVSVDGTTTYNIALNNLPMTETVSGGQPTQILLDWTNPTTLNSTLNGIYDALRNSYEPSFPAVPDCFQAGFCNTGNQYAGGGAWIFSPLNIIMYVNTTVGTVLANSTVTLIDIGLLKLLPFSIGSNLLKLDPAGEGPTSTVTNIGGSGNTCVYKLGMTYTDFDQQCLEVFTSAADNTIAVNKLYGGMAHSDEAYQFDIEGIDPQFAASSLAATAVIGDTQRPTGMDSAYQFTVDQFDLGHIANDFTNNDITQPEDLHGFGMLTLEWAHLVQQYMQVNYGVTADLGDAACIANPAAPGVAGKVCSGIEGIVTTAPPALVPAAYAVNALGVNALNVNPTISGLAPASWESVSFCSVSGAADGTGYAGSSGPMGQLPVIAGNGGPCLGGGIGPLGGYYFDSMQSAVALSFPAGTAVPFTLQTRYFFFEQWMLAAIKYFQTADNPNATLAMIDANPVDANDLFFDTQGTGFDNAFYVDTVSVNSAQQPPTVFTTGFNLTTSIIGDWSFGRYNFRGEKALYTALQTTATDYPGAEPVFLSNIASSPVLQSVYGPGPAGYACAINQDPTNTACNGIVAPLDPNCAPGNTCPLYAPYAGAFGQSVLAVGQQSAMGVSTADFELIASAMVTLPVWSNPFDPTTATSMDPTISVLLPFKPVGANIGFPVTIDGSRDKFYNTNQTDFTGETVNALVDWEYVNIAGAGADGGSGQSLVIRAIETDNYLGQIFVCAEPSISPTAAPGQMDILGVRMFDNGVTILNWIADHPNALAGCEIEIKYSIYGNYADYINSLTNGVRFGLNADVGGSVVTDGTIFDPSIVATLGQ